MARKPARTQSSTRNEVAAAPSRARPQRAPASVRRRGTASALGRSARSHRRVSGPSKKRTARTGRAAALPQIALPQITLPQLPAFGQLRPLPVLGTIGSHAFRVGRRVPDSALFDRLVRGRAWIGLLAVLLFGLVAINVSLLKLNAAAGRNAERLQSLRIQNDRLHATVSRLNSGDRIQRVAARMGLVMPDAGSVQYVTVRAGDGGQASKAIVADRRSPGTGTLASAVVSTPLALTPNVIAPAPAAPATSTASPVTTQAPTGYAPAGTTPTAAQPAATTGPGTAQTGTARAAPPSGTQTGAAVPPGGQATGAYTSPTG